MSAIKFLVQGSADYPYEVFFEKPAAQNLTALCNCPAGEKRQYCKHRFEILKGNTKGIVSGNEQDVAVVRSWLSGTDVENAMQEVEFIESEMEEVKKRLSAAKKKVARAMHD